MASSNSPAHPDGLGATQRPDNWWMPPVSTIIGLTIGFGYLTWAAFFGKVEDGLHVGNLISPVYSPPIQEWFPWINALKPEWLSPAALILWAPGGFRMTCYYYRKAYYRAGMASPPGCGVVGLSQGDYKGESSFPFIFQNVHRYFMYLAVAFVVIFLPMDIIHAMRFETANGTEWGLSLGALVLTANTAFLTFYTFGCHSLRHFIGGKVDCFTCENAGGMRFALWRKVTMFNEKHMLWAWTSLASVTLTDLFVRMVAWGHIENVRFF